MALRENRGPLFEGQLNVAWQQRGAERYSRQQTPRLGEATAEGVAVTSALPKKVVSKKAMIIPIGAYCLSLLGHLDISLRLY